MKLKKFKNFINEAGLSRVWQQTNDKSVAYAIITAFRSERTLSQNRAENRKLTAELRKNGFGFIKLDGFWIENEGTPEEIEVEEESFFITAPPNESDKLKGLIRKMVKTYNQEAAVFRPAATKDGGGSGGDGSAHLIKNNGSEVQIGKPTFSKVGSIYSRMRGRASKTFVFERAVWSKLNWISALSERIDNDTV